MTLDIGRVAWALGAGILLGVLYFYALWWTSRNVANVKRAGLFFVGSFFIRMAVLIGGMYYVTRGRPIDTFVCVIGVMIGRRLVVNRTNIQE